VTISKIWYSMTKAKTEQHASLPMQIRQPGSISMRSALPIYTSTIGSPPDLDIHSNDH